MVNVKKVAIIGCGFVGSSIAFSLIQSGLFFEMVLIDNNKAKAEGEAMDLSHGLAYTGSMNVYAGEYKDLKDAAIIIITAGANQKPGETRLDLIKKNSAIMKSIIGEINKVNIEGMLLIVSNPVDILTHVALTESKLPKNRVIGSGTVLDTARLKYLISEHLHVDTRNVHGLIMGEHGDSEFAAWSITNISGVPLNEFCEIRGFKDHKAGMQKIYEEVRDAAYKIIERKGATYYGIAIAVGHICKSIVNNLHTMMTVSTLLEGEYGLEGLCLSVPTIIGINGVEKVLEIKLSEEERTQLHTSASALKNIIETL
ncbi:MAG: L-lactate dehydrogenase [Bacilli bacterium]|nr:L-lactate dehydrogenase [Bacilli bacterium]